jgi:hypothetical protein
MAFHLARPRGFRHRAGQNMLVTLVDPPQNDSHGPSRTFTIASAPHEDRLTFATRMRDTAFKRVLKSAPAASASRRSWPSRGMRSTGICPTRSCSSTPAAGRRTPRISTSCAR